MPILQTKNLTKRFDGVKAVFLIYFCDCAIFNNKHFWNCL